MTNVLTNPDLSRGKELCEFVADEDTCNKWLALFSQSSMLKSFCFIPEKAGSNA